MAPTAWQRIFKLFSWQNFLAFFPGVSACDGLLGRNWCCGQVRRWGREGGRVGQYQKLYEINTRLFCFCIFFRINVTCITNAWKTTVLKQANIEKEDRLRIPF